jgi:3D-(3,5/4)-trihydroxycyclohexane-1,2-dione acylhydrolase (decyclizing)
VIVMTVDPYEGWTTGGHTWWEIGTPETSTRKSVLEAHEAWESSRSRQRKGV